MADISEVSYVEFEAEGCEYDEDTPVTGSYVAPKSETKTIIIASPPSTSEVPINPRKGILCITKAGLAADYAGLDDLKAKAVDDQEVYVFPVLREDEEDALNDLFATYNFMFMRSGSELNVRKDEIVLAATDECMELAEKFVEFAADEFDVEFDDPEELEL